LWEWWLFLVEAVKPTLRTWWYDLSHLLRWFECKRVGSSRPVAIKL
jgi:hypothetical protein